MGTQGGEQADGPSQGVQCRRPKRHGFRPLEEGMATHSSIPAWRNPWEEESGGLQSIGLQRVRHN